MALDAEYEFENYSATKLQNTEGVELNGWMMKPANFDATKKYPVIMHQYSGPGSQQVLDRWGIGSFRDAGMFEAYMADRGYISVCVDGRGTGGRGAEFEKCTYLFLGVKESHDQVEAAKYLGTLPYVDGSRIGIWGWSFGGYNRSSYCRSYRLALLRLGLHRTFHAYTERKRRWIRCRFSY